MPDEDFVPPPTQAVPPPAHAIRRSQQGPDDRWPTLPGRRWYVYDGDRPIGYLDQVSVNRRGSFKWVPFTLSGGRLAGAWPLSDALAYLVRYDATSWSPLRVCDVCGARIRTRVGGSRGDVTEHRSTCPLPAGLLGYAAIANHPMRPLAVNEADTSSVVGSGSDCEPLNP